jgi:hypothetical protein
MEVKRTMKVFIYGFNRNAEICIYGISGEEETEKFLTKFFADKGLYLLSEEEKKKYNTDAEYAVSKESYEALAQNIERIQAALDAIADDVIKTECDPNEVYQIDGKCYVV